MPVALARRRFLLLGDIGRDVAQSAADGCKARVAGGCLSARGIVCRSCGEHCEPGAIRFELLPAGRALPLIDPGRCNGCGQCERVCPARAIVLRALDEAAS